MSNMVTLRFRTMLVRTAYTKEGEEVIDSFDIIEFKKSTTVSQTLLMSLDLVMTVPGALGLYEFLTLTGMSPSLAGLMDSGCNTCNEGEICSAIQSSSAIIDNLTRDYLSTKVSKLSCLIER